VTRAAEVAGRVADVRGRISAAARRAGRDPGVTAFGENRVQEAEAKFPFLPPGCAAHLVGPIQSNKASRAAKIATAVETIDSGDIARRLDRAASALGKRLEVYVQVRLGGEETKSGVEPGDAAALVAFVQTLPALDLRGLMTIPPPGDTRPHFAALRALAESLGLAGLSMGMSDDFEAAVEEGATLVRVGSAIFGARE
jgi:pyridoxal phosphate enzyme (YggS family)